jgi:hypothetical protein
MLKKFEMKDCKPVTTPMQTNCKLNKNDDSKSTNHRKYKSMIGNLLYVTSSRPNVMQKVGQVARIEEAPKESHVLVVKRIFRYLKGAKDFGLWYPKGMDLSLISYSDADWEAFIDDQRRTSGEMFYFSDCLVSCLIFPRRRSIGESDNASHNPSSNQKLLRGANLNCGAPLVWVTKQWGSKLG